MIHGHRRRMKLLPYLHGHRHLRMKLLLIHLHGHHRLLLGRILVFFFDLIKLKLIIILKL
jgi:hypothetical protein